RVTLCGFMTPRDEGALPAPSSLRGEKLLHPWLHLGRQKRERLDQVLLGKSAQIHLQEVTHVPHMAVQVSNALSDIVGVADIVRTRRMRLGSVVVIAWRRPAPQLAH